MFIHFIVQGKGNILIPLSLFEFCLLCICVLGTFTNQEASVHLQAIFNQCLNSSKKQLCDNLEFVEQCLYNAYIIIK